MDHDGYIAECERSIALMRAHGWRMEVCPMIDLNSMPGSYRSIALPEALARRLTIIVGVEGETMSDFDLHDGDEMAVRLQTDARCDDVVLVDYDGRLIVRIFYRDADSAWLVSRDSAVPPLEVTDSHDVRIIGTVRRVMHANLRGDSYACRKAVEAYRRQSASSVPASRLASALPRIASMLKAKRQWFAVYRILADRGIIAEADWSAFVALISRHVHPAPDIDINDIRRLNIGCFAKPFDRWTREKSPARKSYGDYCTVAQAFIRLLDS